MSTQEPDPMASWVGDRGTMDLPTGVNSRYSEVYSRAMWYRPIASPGPILDGYGYKYNYETQKNVH